MANVPSSHDYNCEAFIRELSAKGLFRTSTKQVPEFPISNLPSKIQPFVQEASDWGLF